MSVRSLFGQKPPTKPVGDPGSFGDAIATPRTIASAISGSCP